ncbi:MAG: tetratricopeptide repeat protein [Chryseolinea sp.]
MRSTLAVVCMLSLGASMMYGQNVELIGKLKKDIVDADDQKKFDILTDLSWEYRTSLPDSGIYYGLKAYTLGLELNRADLARPLNFIGVSYNHKGNHLDAYDFFTRALKTSEGRDDSLQIAHACNNLGRLFLEQGLLTKAHRYLDRSKRIFERLKDYASLAYAYQSIAAYNMAIKNNAQAEFNYKKAYEIRSIIQDKPRLVAAIIPLGKFYMDTDRINTALKYFRIGDSIAMSIHDELLIAEIKTHRGQCQLLKGNLDEAERLVTSGITRIEASGNLRLLPDAYLTMGQLQFKKNNFIKAKEYFTLMLKVSALRKDLRTRMEANFFLWQTLKKENSDNSATIDHYTQYLVLRDSLHTLESQQRTEQLKFHIEIEKRDKENEILRIRDFQKTAIILVLAVMIMLIGIILYTQIKFRAKILRINRQLEDRNQAIKNFNHILNEKRLMLEKHIHTLTNFSKNASIQAGRLEPALKDIVKAVAQNLNTSRVSIWLYNDAEQCIETLTLFESEPERFPDNIKLSFAQAPKYFAAIKQEKIIIAEDARTHPATSEFSDSYLIPGDIFSMLDVTFYEDEKLKGLLCCEQQHNTRKWTAEDRIFVSCMSDIISLALHIAQRTKYEEAITVQNTQIAKMNESLEIRVKQRTEELEEQNKKLMEYAFINSHVLRGPVSRIMGLINLFEHADVMETSEIVALLKKSSEELDTVVQKITAALHEGAHLTKEDFE